jgi:hypothetical protein
MQGQKLSLVVTLLVLLAGATSPSSAQTYACAATASNDAKTLKDYATRLTSGDATLETTRTTYSLPLTPAKQVSLVTTKSVCQQAAQAYHRAVRGPTVPQISRTVVVVKVGSTRYLVLDPVEQAGEYNVTVVFDAGFAPIAAFNS